MKKSNLLILFVLIVSFQVSAWQSVDEIIKNSPSSGKYPDASGAILYFSQNFKLDSEGKRVEENIWVLKIFNVHGREKFSDFRIPFDKKREKIELVMGRTYKSDLSYVEVEKGAINDVTPPNLSDADIYSNLVHRVVSFPAVEPLKCLVINYKKEGTEEESNIDGIVYFQTDEPVVKKELRIEIPKGKNLKYKIINLNLDLNEDFRENSKIYMITVNDSAQIKPEEFMPPESEISSRIIFSTYRDWFEAVSPFSNFFFEAIKPTEYLEKFTKRLIKNEKGFEDKIKKIYNFVAKDIRNIELDFGYGGYNVHSAEKVLQNRYGDWKDKSALFVSMLKIAGIDSFPVLANKDRVPIVKDVPTMKQFNAVLVAIPDGEDYIFLSPFSDSSHFGYFLEGKDSDGIIIRPHGTEFVRIHCLKEERSISKSEIVGKIDKNGNLRGEISVELSGLFDKMARKELKDKTSKELEIFFKESVNRLFEESKSIGFHLSNLKDIFEKVSVSQEFFAEKFALYQGDVMLLNIPGIPYSFAALPSAPRLSKRNYPFLIPDESEISSETKLIVPEGFEPIYLPEGVNTKKDFGEFYFSVSFDKGKSQMVVRKKFVFLKREISLEEYEEFKNIIDSLGIAKNRLVLLEKR